MLGRTECSNAQSNSCLALQSLCCVWVSFTFGSGEEGTVAEEGDSIIPVILLVRAWEEGVLGASLVRSRERWRSEASSFGRARWHRLSRDCRGRPGRRGALQQKCYNN